MNILHKDAHSYRTIFASQHFKCTYIVDNFGLKTTVVQSFLTQDNYVHIYRCALQIYIRWIREGTKDSDAIIRN